MQKQKQTKQTNKTNKNKNKQTNKQKTNKQTKPNKQYLLFQNGASIHTSISRKPSHDQISKNNFPIFLMKFGSMC